MRPIFIMKGDCTNFADSQLINITIQTDYDVTGWKCIFKICKIVKTIENITEPFCVAFNSTETNSLPLGINYADIKLVDSVGNIKTVANKIPVEVTNNIIENTPQNVKVYIAGAMFQIKIVGNSNDSGTSNHPMLDNLEYQNSGHIGFASSDDINRLQLEIEETNINTSNFLEQVEGIETEIQSILTQIETKQPAGDYATQTDLDEKQDVLTAGSNIQIQDNVISCTMESGITDYNELTSLPLINNVVLSGNKTLSDLGIQPNGEYATILELEQKQDILTQDQLNSVNSGITSDKVSQYDLYETTKVSATEYNLFKTNVESQLEGLEELLSEV